MYGFRSVFSYSGVTSCWVSGDVDLVELLLVAAGDVETNPGPVKAGLLKAFLKDLKSVQDKYGSLGIKLKVSQEQIEAFEKIYNGNHERIFIEVINIWLNSYDENYVELFINEKKEFDGTCLTPTFSKGDYVNSLCGALREIGEMELAELLKRKYESQQRLLQSLLQDLRSVEEKYAAIGVELEVGLFHISLLESKYQDDKRNIFTEVLHCWLDNYSRDDYIQYLCAALKAVNEPAVAERIQTKYSSMKEESLAPTRKALKMEEAVVEQDQEKTAPAAMNSDEPEADSYSRISAPSKKPEHRLPSDSERENSPKRSRRIPEGVDGSPEMFQRQTYFVRPTRDKTGHAELDLTVPSEALKRHIDKLKMLGDTMKKDGDTRFALEINGRYCNTPWSRMTWTIHSTSDPVGGTVKAVVKIDFCILRAIQDGIEEKIKGGVKTFVYEALDKEHPVDVE